MKIYTKIILDNKNTIIEEEYYNYDGPMSLAGIHYDFKSTKSSKLMEKQAKRDKKLAERKAKREAKEGPKKKDPEKSLDTSKPITLDFLTNPDKK
jgi:hypothetical protein